VISGGGQHSLSGCTDSIARSWGFNSRGALGDGTTTDRWAPVQVTSLCQVFTAVAEQQEENDFLIYPNPTTGQLSVNGYKLSG